MGDVKARIRLPAGGNAAEASTITQDPQSQTGNNYFPVKEWSITDDMLNLSDSACVTIANIDGENTGRFAVGQRVEFDTADSDVANGQWCRHFTGRVTGIQTHSDGGGGSTIMLSMMDLGWHLTSSHGKPLTRIKGIRFSKLLEFLIDPSWGFLSENGHLLIQGTNDLNKRLKHGRQVILINHKPQLGAVLPLIQIEPGQTPFDLIKLYAQRDGFLVNVGARGELIFFRPSYNDPALYHLNYHGTQRPEHAGNNVVGSPRVSETIDGVYSEVTCYSTVVIPPEIVNTENPNEMYRKNVSSPSPNPLPFTRRWVMSDGEAINERLRTNRATWTWQMGLFNSWTYEVEVPTHSIDGAFLVSDTMIAISDTVNGVSGTYYVQSVRRSSTLRDGTRAALTIRRPGLLNPELASIELGGGAKKAAKRPKAKK
jgi:hypothetical protein